MKTLLATLVLLGVSSSVFAYDYQYDTVMKMDKYLTEQGRRDNLRLMSPEMADTLDQMNPLIYR